MIKINLILSVLLIILIRIIKINEAVIYKIPLIYSGHASRTGENLLRSSKAAGGAGQGYYITVDIGKPSQKINVLVDTGSSNFAIASAPNPLITKYFHPNESETFRWLGTQVSVPYTQGEWSGTLGCDQVTISSAPEVSVRAQVALIATSDNFFVNGSDWQGIVGLAHPPIARPTAAVVPFLDRLVANRSLSNVFSLQLCGGNATSGGTMVLGGIDPKLYSGDLTYALVRRQWYYEVILTELVVGDVPVNLHCSELNNDKTIVDSGTTNLRLPRQVFREVVASLRRQVRLQEVDEIPEEFWEGERVMCWLVDDVPWQLFPRLKLSLAHSTANGSFVLSIPPQQYMREAEGISSNGLGCFKFAIKPSDSGTVLGTVVMEGFYLVFDRQNKRIGFARSTCSPLAADQTSLILGPFPFPADPMQCVYSSPPPPPSLTGSAVLLVVAYSMAAICLLCFLLLLLMLGQWVARVAVARKRRTSLCDTAILFDE